VRRSSTADAELKELVTATAPGLLTLCGVGIEVAGQLLTTAGDNPHRPHSPGRLRSPVRCRTDPGQQRTRPTVTGSTVAATEPPTPPCTPSCSPRLRCDPRTHRYLQRRTKEGLSKPEIIRCLKRYLAREIYQVLVSLPPSSSSSPPHSPERVGQP
jgi:hypothetical protein